MKQVGSPKKKLWKKIVIISAIVLVIVVPLFYVYLSMQAWNTASENSTQASTNLIETVDSQLATETTPEPLQAAIESTLATYKQSIVDGPCVLPSAYEWQSNLPWLKDDRQQCLDAVNSSEALAASLETLLSFMKQEEAAAILVDTAIENTAKATDYTAAAKTWQSVADDPSLVTDTAFRPVGEEIIEVSEGIANAYTALAKASKGEDKAAFDKAEKNLKSAYAQLPDIQTVANEARAPLIDAVVTAYEAV